VVLWLVGLAVPSLTTFVSSFQHTNLMRPGGEWVGLANYGQLGRLAPVSSAVIAVLSAFVAVIPGAVGGSLIGALAGRGTRVARGATAAVLGALAVFWAPVGVTLSLWAFDPRSGGSPLPSQQPELAVLLGTLVVLLPMTLATTGMTGILFARGQAGRRTVPALVAAAVGVLASLAIALQTFTVAYVTTAGGPQNRTASPVLAAWQSFFIRFEPGPSAAASVVLGLVLGVLGLAAGVLLITSRTRLWLGPPADSPGRSGSPLGWVGLGLALLAVVLVVAVTHRSWLGSFGHATPDLPPQLTVMTWAPPFLVVAVQLVVAALAGIGIGALRPLGRASEWLLLPFVPWLFVGEGPLVTAHYLTANTLGMINRPWYSPVWISVPLLVIATLVAGAVSRRRAEAEHTASVKDTVLGVVGATVAVATTAWIVRANSLLWPLTALTQVDDAPASVVLLQQASASQYSGAAGIVFTAGTPIVLFVLQLILVAGGCWLALDRFSLQVSPAAERPGPPPDVTAQA